MTLLAHPQASVQPLRTLSLLLPLTLSETTSNRGWVDFLREKPEQIWGVIVWLGDRFMRGSGCSCWWECVVCQKYSVAPPCWFLQIPPKVWIYLVFFTSKTNWLFWREHYCIQIVRFVSALISAPACQRSLALQSFRCLTLRSQVSTTSAGYATLFCKWKWGEVVWQCWLVWNLSSVPITVLFLIKTCSSFCCWKNRVIWAF